MNDTDRPTNESVVAYCQNCGRPLRTEDARNVGSAVFCEPCLITKVGGASPGAGPGAGPQAGSGAAPGTGAGGSYGFSGTSSGANYDFRGSMPPPMPPPMRGAPNPTLAALLGFIPGVGAFYNGQYAKGVVHLVVFAVLTTLSDKNGIFGIFVAGWIFYQVLEAHHTARARRDGTPLPNPFQLNDIGERLGFGRAWPGSSSGGGWSSGTGGTTADQSGATSSTSAYPPPPAASAYVPPAATYAPPPNAYGSYVPPSPSWGGPTEEYGAVPPFATPPPAAGSGVGSSLSSRVPVGAILLIALGVLFLIGNSGFMHGFPIYRLIPFLLIGLGVWLFVRKMMETGTGLADDGTSAYRLRLFRAARGPVWIVLVGLLFLLNDFNILSWGRSWPLFIIVGGLMTFFERTAYSTPGPAQYSYVPPAPMAGGPATAGAPAAAAASSSTAPADVREREGS